MQDWADEVDVTIEQADHLNDLQKLRETDPILWALMLGLRTSRSIARHITQPHYYVLRYLRACKMETGHVTDREGRRSVEWVLTEKLPNELWELTLWVRAELKPGGLFNPNEEREA
jgi:hypothetical protein